MSLAPSAMAKNAIEPVEIEDMDTWNALVQKSNEDINVIDVYAKWCGPCMCESAKTWHRLAARTVTRLAVLSVVPSRC